MRITVEINENDVFEYEYKFRNGTMQHGTMPVCGETLSLFSQMIQCLEKSRHNRDIRKSEEL